MIAFAACIGDERKFRRCAVPGLRLAAEPNSVIAQFEGADSIFTAYNEVLGALAPREDLEALVLLHEDAEIVDPDFCGRVRRILADETIGVVGVAGARGVTTLAWWEGECFGRVRETRGIIDWGGGCHDVDAVDGLLMVLSARAVRELRFDSGRYSGFHGYDADICFQARAAGMRVVVDEIDVVHHTKGGFGDEAAFAAADRAFREKWALAGAAV